MLAQKSKLVGFRNQFYFSKILLVGKAEEEVIEIPYKITTVTSNLLHIKPMQNYSRQLINNYVMHD